MRKFSQTAICFTRFGYDFVGARAWRRLCLKPPLARFNPLTLELCWGVEEACKQGRISCEQLTRITACLPLLAQHHIAAMAHNPTQAHSCNRGAARVIYHNASVPSSQCTMQGRVRWRIPLYLFFSSAAHSPMLTSLWRSLSTSSLPVA